MLLDVFEM